MRAASHGVYDRYMAKVGIGGNLPGGMPQAERDRRSREAQLKQQAALAHPATPDQTIQEPGGGPSAGTSEPTGATPADVRTDRPAPSYVEQMPNGGKMECKYVESDRITVAQYYKDMANAESEEVNISGNLFNEKPKITYKVNGKEVENPLQAALNNGTCVISGY